MLNVETMANPDARLAELLHFLTHKSVCRGDFTLSSGAKSDLYVDAKLTTLDPRGAVLVGKIGWELIKAKIASEHVRVDSVGGLTMGADAIALSIGIAAQIDDPQTSIQTFSVRKSAKTHGRHKLIEGNFNSGDSVVIIDDVITTGGSTLQAIDAVQAEGGKVAFVVVLVDREEGGRQRIEERGIPVIPILTRRDIIRATSGERKHSTAA